MPPYDPQQEGERRKKFYLSRTIDLGQIATIFLVFLGGMTALGSVYWTVSSRIDALQVSQLAVETQNKLLQQRIDQDEHTIDAVQRQIQSYVADTRDWEKSFSGEMRNNMQQLSQSISDLRTLVASQRDGHR